MQSIYSTYEILLRHGIRSNRKVFRHPRRQKRFEIIYDDNLIQTEFINKIQKSK